MKGKKKVQVNKFSGEIKPLTSTDPFYMVLVEGSVYTPTIKHEDYNAAFEEMLRLSKKENKKAWVMVSVTQVEQVPNVTQLANMTES